MKKLLKKLAKKSIALLMVCLTLVTYVSLLSPSHKVYAAADSHNYSLSELHNTYLTTDAINSTGAGFATPSYAGTAVTSGRYANVLKSSNYTNDAYTGTITVDTPKLHDDNCDKKDLNVNWDWHVPTDTRLFFLLTPRATVIL